METKENLIFMNFSGPFSAVFSRQKKKTLEKDRKSILTSEWWWTLFYAHCESLWWVMQWFFWQNDSSTDLSVAFKELKNQINGKSLGTLSWKSVGNKFPKMRTGSNKERRYLGHFEQHESAQKFSCISNLLSLCRQTAVAANKSRIFQPRWSEFIEFFSHFLYGVKHQNQATLCICWHVECFVIRSRSTRDEGTWNGKNVMWVPAQGPPLMEAESNSLEATPFSSRRRCLSLVIPPFPSTLTHNDYFMILGSNFQCPCSTPFMNILVRKIKYPSRPPACVNVTWTRSENYDVIGLVGAIKQIIKKIRVRIALLLELNFVV